MLRRDVVSLRIGLRRLPELRERLGVVAVRQVEQPRRAVRDRAVRVRVERLLREQRTPPPSRRARGDESASSASAVASAGFRTRTSRASAIALSICSALARARPRRASAPRPRSGGRRRSPPARRRRASVLAAPPPHLGERDGDVLRVRRELRRGRASCVLGAGEVPRVRRAPRRGRSAPPRGSGRCWIASRRSETARSRCPYPSRPARPAPSWRPRRGSAGGKLHRRSRARAHGLRSAARGQREARAPWRHDATTARQSRGRRRSARRSSGPRRRGLRGRGADRTRSAPR